MILNIFAAATGLTTNMQKTELYPIRCEEVDLTFLANSGRTLSTFPCKYLGLPLNIRRPTRATMQPLVEKIANRLPGWKTEFMSCPGRELLIKSVMTSMPTYFMTIFKLSKWAIKAIDRFRRSFLWKGKNPDQVAGGHCLVNWRMCLQPRKLGGLGIKDLEKFNRALRLRWLWHQWDQTQRPWKNLLMHKDKVDRALFFASTTIQIGNGRKTPFWEARWLQGAAPK